MQDSGRRVAGAAIGFGGLECLQVDIPTTAPDVHRWIAIGRHLWSPVDIDVHRWQFGLMAITG